MNLKAYPLHFTLTCSQRQQLADWLDRQSSDSQLPTYFTIAFTVTPHGVQIRAHLDSADKLKAQEEIQPGECYLQLVENVGGFFLTPQNGFRNVKLWASAEGSFDSENPAIPSEPVLSYAWLQDDPERTMIPLVVSENMAEWPHWRLSDPLLTHPLSLYRKDRNITDEEWTWLRAHLRLHRNALEDHWHGRIYSGDLCSRNIAVREFLPDGVTQPLSAEHWRRIGQLNERLVEAEGFARSNAVKLRPLTESVVCDLTCRLRQDDPDYSETCDNIIHRHSLSLPEDRAVDEDWNTFRNCPDDPLGGRRCSYFMHVLIEHGKLNARDLLRIGTVSLQVIAKACREFALH
jgi:hypothetical protein